MARKRAGNSDSRIRFKAWPFYIASAVLLIAGIVLSVSYFYNDYRIWQVHGLAVLLLCLSTFVFSIPSLRQEKLDILANRSMGAMDDFSEKDSLDSLKRELYKEHMKLDTIYESVEEGFTNLHDALESFKAIIYTRQTAENEIIDARIDCANAKKEVREWCNRSIEMIKFFERTLSLPEVNPDYRSAIEKSLYELSQTFQPMGLIVIRPGIGDLFDDRTHEAAGEVSNVSLEDGCIADVLNWGFQFGSEVLERARIILVKPPN